MSPELAGRFWTTREVSTPTFSPFCPLISCRCLPLAGTKGKPEDAGVWTLPLSRAVSHGTGGSGQRWRGEQSRAVSHGTGAVDRGGGVNSEQPVHHPTQGGPHPSLAITLMPSPWMLLSFIVLPQSPSKMIFCMHLVMCLLSGFSMGYVWTFLYVG